MTRARKKTKKVSKKYQKPSDRRTEIKAIMQYESF